MRIKGKVVKWFDDKGYGFVSTSDIDEKIFAHIRAFPKSAERPKISEEVTYDLIKDAKNRMQASNILYVNRPGKELTLLDEITKLKRLKSKAPYTVRLRYKTKKTNSFRYFWVIILIVLSVMIWGKYHHILNNFSLMPDHTVRIQKNLPELKQDLMKPTNNYETNQFQCRGKTHCSEMTSCEEAKFYLQNCSGTISDGDGDGIPCEDQWCGH